MKKDLTIIGGLFLLIVVIIVFGRQFTSGSLIGFASPQPATKSASQKSTTTVTIGDLNIEAQIASTADKRKKGLSELDELPIANGMLFVFDKVGSYPIWMKDMKFPIDIIWIDDRKNIVDIAENALPEPGKKDKELKIYKPRADSKYILEINAGLVRLHNLQIGETVSFTL